MIELQGDSLVFSFPEVHPEARFTISFQRTLRIPDDGKDYPLPPGLGHFPLRHVDDFATCVNPAWIEHGGVMLPMYQSEALWLNFDSDFIDGHDVEYPFAVKVATGKVNAVSGGTWSSGLNRAPRQDYLVVPKQPWLDGYCVEQGIIRQFVAMPLGAGYTAEEQVTGKAEHGGLQIMVMPMKRVEFERRFPKRERQRGILRESRICYAPSAPLSSMGLAPGGRMKQEIRKDPYRLTDWDMDHSSRTFVHIANSMMWRQITGENPPTTPLTAKEYTDAGMPWFQIYEEKKTALEGSDTLARMKSVAEMGKKKKEMPLPENQSVVVEKVVFLRKGLKEGQVREWKE